MRKLSIITLFLLSTFAVVSCGGNEEGEGTSSEKKATESMEGSFDKVHNSMGTDFVVFTKSDRSETIYFIFKKNDPELVKDGKANEEFVGKTFKVDYYNEFDDGFQEDLHYITNLKAE